MRIVFFLAWMFCRTLSSGPSSILKGACLSLRSGFKTTWQWWQASSLGLHCYRWETNGNSFAWFLSIFYVTNVKILLFSASDFWHLSSTESCERHWSRERELVSGATFVLMYAVNFFLQFHKSLSLMSLSLFLIVGFCELGRPLQRISHKMFTVPTEWITLCFAVDISGCKFNVQCFYRQLR